ncbi:F510_1955 family glycosylhydrolase [Streptomyces sp. H27-S2]|uniref:F510_1955 family glycosylhydrolase n=1 Tax=Streptomyces antarcticus TaxID=2996458 RepID=UPI0022702FD7|nr:exo-alpha-sialidase [Streptomyces sp. H27-S2]MCY0949867.1 exo-alpha-sialidase [Streptomyces sp. H27-S2]
MTVRLRFRTVFAATAATLAAVTLAACGAGSSGDESADASPPLAHVHGLGVDPADGRVYVATHVGLYSVSAGTDPKLVGDRKDDFMGFTVTGKGTFIASGHGAPGGGQPGNLGLIESTDAGRTWTSRSLADEADFHSLDSAGGTVYGYEGGRIRVTTDLKTWDDRASLKALDLAAGPGGGERLLATTSEGVAASADGGRTFGKATGAVQAYVSWPEEKVLFGIDPAGKLSRSEDGGTSWTVITTVPGGAPQALTAVDARHVLAATQDGVYESRDGGQTFTPLSPPSS